MLTVAFVTRPKTRPLSLPLDTTEAPSSPSVLSALAASLREAAEALVGICGAVVFFSALAGILSALSFLPHPVELALLSLLELTTLAGSAAATLTPNVALLVLAFGCGWSGLSVHAQVALVTEGRYPLTRYIAYKLLCGWLSAALCALALLLKIL